MTNKKTDKQQVVATAAELFRTKGYSDTSIADIANACQLSKGSIYHYITSKQDLAIAVLRDIYNNFKDRIFAKAYNSGSSVEQRLQDFATALEGYYSQLQGGCLMGSFVAETVHTMPGFKQVLSDHFDEWFNALVNILTPVHGEAKARQLAEESVCNVQGAVLMSQLYADERFIKRSIANIVDLAKQ